MKPPNVTHKECSREAKQCRSVWPLPAGHLSPLRLRPDFQRRWDAVWPVVAGLYARRAIFGFFLGDELVWMGVTPAELNTAAEAVKRDFPGAIIWVNEAAGVLAGGCSHFRVCHKVSEVVPPAVNWVSADRYWSSPPHRPGAHAAALKVRRRTFTPDWACLDPGLTALGYSA